MELDFTLFLYIFLQGHENNRTFTSRNDSEAAHLINIVVTGKTVFIEKNYLQHNFYKVVKSNQRLMTLFEI